MSAHNQEQPYKIPDFSIYKVEDVPKLMEVKEALARQGLKNPWLRNEAWRYDVKQFGTYGQRLRVFFGRGVIYGFGLAVLTVAVEKFLDRNGNDHGNSHEKSSDHH